MVIAYVRPCMVPSLHMVPLDTCQNVHVALWMPLGTDTDRTTGDFQSGTDDGGHGGAGSSGGHGSAGISGGHGGAGNSEGHGRWCLWPWPRSPRPGPYSRNPFYPQKKFPGEVRGYQEPSGAKHRHRTGQPSGARHTGQDSPPGTGSPPGLARKLRLLLGMARSQGPSQGPSATAPTSATRGQAAGNGLHGHYKKSRLPQTSLHGQDRQDTLKLFLRALSQRRAGGHWVRGRPAGMGEWQPGN